MWSTLLQLTDAHQHRDTFTLLKIKYLNAITQFYSIGPQLRQI